MKVAEVRDTEPELCPCISMPDRLVNWLIWLLAGSRIFSLSNHKITQDGGVGVGMHGGKKGGLPPPLAVSFQAL